jgi:hypothetical protein
MRIGTSARTASVCGVVAVVVAAVAMVPMLRSHAWNPSSLAHVASGSALGKEAKALDPGFRTVPHGGYDGQFYWGIAVDPLASGVLPHAFDKASYRYGHPLYGWLAWLASAGQAVAVPAALVLLGLAAVFTAAFFAARIGGFRRGVLVALSPGLAIAAAHDLGEPIAAAALFAALAAWASGRRALAWVCLAALPLAKEELVLVIAAVAAWELVCRRRRHAAVVAAAAVPALLWWVYARVQLGAWFTSGTSALGDPLAGWRRALDVPRGSAAREAVLALLLAVLCAAFLRALRIRGPIDLAYLALGIVAVCLAANATVALTTALRNTAFLLALVPFVGLRVHDSKSYSTSANESVAKT